MTPTQDDMEAARRQAAKIKLKPGQTLIWMWRHWEGKYVFRIMPA